MATVALDNASWGFASTCFVCEPSNEGGLRIPFFHDEERQAVFADYTLDAAFSGAPSYAHGGVTMAILDEAMAWATIAVGKSFALTRSTSVEFGWPIRVGRQYRVEATIVQQTTQDIETEARVLDQKGRVCASARSHFRPMNAEQAADAIGADIAGTSDETYLRSE